MLMYLFVFLFILSILYFIFGWKHDLYGKYKHELDYIQLMQKKKKITLNFNYPMVNTLIS